MKTKAISLPKTEQAMEVQQMNSAEALIAQAIDKNVPVETIERLLAMRRELRAEAAKEAYDRSLAAFQSECPIIEKTKLVKDSKGNVLYPYAPIEAIVGQVKDLLMKHGFSYRTNTRMEGGNVTAICRGTHTFGHSEESEMTVPVGSGTSIMSGPQKVAAAVTYAKRYAFLNLFGIMTGDEDTDAVPASLPKEEAMATSQQLKQIDLLIGPDQETRTKAFEWVMRTWGHDITDFTEKEAAALIQVLEKKKLSA